MGKKARLKKQARVEETLQERQAILARKKAATRPTLRLAKRLIFALILTIVLLYIGQFVDRKIAAAEGPVTEATP